MTGIERLRTLAGAWDEYGLGGTLGSVADQIERERACDEDAIESVRLIVGGVIDDMERHTLGHEGMEDSPVARWARELRDALKSDTSDERDAQDPSCADPDGADDVTSDAPKVTRDPAEDVSMSAYDLLPEEDREAIAWVRKHGGLEKVKLDAACWNTAENIAQTTLDWLARVCSVAGIEKCGYGIALERLEDAISSRLMPEGMDWLLDVWPRFEGGEPVGFGDEVSRLGEVFSISLYCDGSFALNFRAYSKGERVRRPAPKVPDADGVDTSVGDTVYDVDTGEKMWVCALPEQGAYQCVKLRLINGMFKTLDPCRFTHERPEVDSWSRLEEDAKLSLCEYNLRHKPAAGDGTTLGEDVRVDLVRRARALAERGE